MKIPKEFTATIIKVAKKDAKTRASAGKLQGSQVKKVCK